MADAPDGFGPSSIGSGLLFRLVPEALGGSGSIPCRQLAEGLRALDCRDVWGTARLAGDAIEVRMTLRLDRNAEAPAPDRPGLA